MPRRYSASETEKKARAKRDGAFGRASINPTVPRRSAAGVTSAPIKAEDPETRRLIDEALARRQP